MSPLPHDQAFGIFADVAPTAAPAGVNPLPHFTIEVDPPSATENKMQDPNPANIHGHLTGLQRTRHHPNHMLGNRECQSPLDRSYDYEAKYPKDAPGEETGPNARVFKVYLDEADIYDADMIGGFREFLNEVIIFVSTIDPLLASVLTPR